MTSCARKMCSWFTINISNITELIKSLHDFQLRTFKRYEQQIIIRNIEQIIMKRYILRTFVQHNRKYVLLCYAARTFHSELPFPTAVVALVVVRISANTFLSPCELNRCV